MPKPTTGRTSSWSINAVRLNFREVWSTRSARHPAHLSTPPSDAFAVLWLETIGITPDPRIAYLNHARALHLYQELGRILGGAPPENAVERTRRVLNLTEGARGEVSGA